MKRVTREMPVLCNPVRTETSCLATTKMSEAATESGLNPFASGVLTEDHEKQIVTIRSCFGVWLAAASDSRKKVAGAKEKLQAATEDLKSRLNAAPY